MSQHRMQRVECEPAFILHVRAYRETSVLLDVFTQSYGRIALIARGVRKARSQWRGILQPFVPLLVSWSGKSQLMTLKTAEMRGAPLSLTGPGLLSGLYINELLVRLLYADEMLDALFSDYQALLETLQQTQNIAAELRLFEKHLLDALGMVPEFHVDATTGAPIDPNTRYQWVVGEGFVALPALTQHSGAIPGSVLLALHAHQLYDLSKPEALACKRLMRMLMQTALEGRPLQSRALFVLPESKESEICD